MDMRQFLERMAIAAPLAATSPMMRGAISKFSGIAAKMTRLGFLTKVLA
jgi:hypothetical protein